MRHPRQSPRRREGGADGSRVGPSRDDENWYDGAPICFKTCPYEKNQVTIETSQYWAMSNTNTTEKTGIEPITC